MRWTAKPSWVLVAVAGVLLPVGCGTAADRSAGGPASSAPTTVAPAPPGSTARAPAVGPTAEADAICARIDAQIAAVPQPAGATEVEPYLRRLVGIYRGEVAELQAVADRTGDPRWQQLVDELSAYFALVEADLPQLAQDPARMNAPGTPTGQALDRARLRAEALGLQVCGASGSGSSPDGTAPAPAPVASALSPVVGGWRGAGVGDVRSAP